MALFSKERLWPTLITVALLGNVALGFILIRVAGGDEHFAVEPNYYRKAVNWDSTAAQVARNADLGWELAPRLGALTAGTQPVFGLTLRARDGGALAGVLVSIEAMPVAYAGEVLGVQLPATDSLGQASAAVAISRTGLWEFRLTARRGSDRFTTNVRLDVSSTSEAVVVTERPGDPKP